MPIFGTSIAGLCRNVQAQLSMTSCLCTGAEPVFLLKYAHKQQTAAKRVPIPAGSENLGRGFTWRGSSPTIGACPPSYRRRRLASVAPSPECATRRCRCSRTRPSWRWGLRTLADKRGKNVFLICRTESRIQRVVNLAYFVKPFPAIM